MGFDGSHEDATRRLGNAHGLQQRVILIDGDRLAELMIEFGVGVRSYRKVEVKRVDEDFFAD